MSKRYVANERMPWGKQHLTKGQELLEPSPDTYPKAGIDALIHMGRIREMTPEEMAPPPKKKRETKVEPTYRTRALTAEEPARDPAPDPAPTPPRRSRVGAMTTENTDLVQKNDE